MSKSSNRCLLPTKSHDGSHELEFSDALKNLKGDLYLEKLLCLF